MHEPSLTMASFKYFLGFFLTFLVVSSALDMSIIDYDKNHGQMTGDDEVRALFESWLVKHGKNYNALGEKEKRFDIFKDNLRFISQHNNAQDRPYKLGLNRFADLTNEEYRAMFVGGRMDRTNRLVKRRSNDRYALQAGDSLPESVDWRAKGAVAAVKDQGQCGEFS